MTDDDNEIVVKSNAAPIPLELGAELTRAKQSGLNWARDALEVWTTSLLNVWVPL